MCTHRLCQLVHFACTVSFICLFQWGLLEKIIAGIELKKVTAIPIPANFRVCVLWNSTICVLLLFSICISCVRIWSRYPPQVSLSLSLARARSFSLAFAVSFSLTHLVLPFYCSLLSHTRDSLAFLYILTGLLFLALWLSCSCCLPWRDSSTRLPFVYCIMSHT